MRYLQDQYEEQLNNLCAAFRSNLARLSAHQRPTTSLLDKQRAAVGGASASLGLGQDDARTVMGVGNELPGQSVFGRSLLMRHFMQGFRGDCQRSLDTAKVRFCRGRRAQASASDMEAARRCGFDAMHSCRCGDASAREVFSVGDVLALGGAHGCLPFVCETTMVPTYRPAGGNGIRVTSWLLCVRVYACGACAMIGPRSSCSTPNNDAGAAARGARQRRQCVYHRRGRIRRRAG
jgi:hypothetical protein